MLKSSISLKNETYGDYSEQVSDTYKLMGSIHLAEGNIEKALRCYKKVSFEQVSDTYKLRGARWPGG